MSLKTDLFYNNQLYKLISNPTIYSNELLQEINSLLHQQPEHFLHHQQADSIH